MAMTIILKPIRLSTRSISYMPIPHVGSYILRLPAAADVHWSI
jgi:hypothetical protein